MLKLHGRRRVGNGLVFIGIGFLPDPFEELQLLVGIGGIYHKGALAQTFRLAQLFCLILCVRGTHGIGIFDGQLVHLHGGEARTELFRQLLLLSLLAQD